MEVTKSSPLCRGGTEAQRSQRHSLECTASPAVEQRSNQGLSCFKWHNTKILLLEKDSSHWEWYLLSTEVEKKKRNSSKNLLIKRWILWRIQLLKKILGALCSQVLGRKGEGSLGLQGHKPLFMSHDSCFEWVNMPSIILPEVGEPCQHHPLERAFRNPPPPAHTSSSILAGAYLLSP